MQVLLLAGFTIDSWAPISSGRVASYEMTDCVLAFVVLETC